MGNLSSVRHRNECETSVENQIAPMKEAPMTTEVRQLHFAVMCNRWEVVRYLAENGVDVNHPWYDYNSPQVKNGTTPLCEAVSLNHIPVVHILLEAGAKVNKPDRFGLTPLHKAAYHGYKNLVEILVREGADIQSRDPNLRTPLHLCVEQAVIRIRDETVPTLLSLGALVNAKTADGQTPLHEAARYALPDIVRVLLKAQAKIDSTDLEYQTPLFYCVDAVKAVLAKQKRQALNVSRLSCSSCTKNEESYREADTVVTRRNAVVFGKYAPTVNVLLQSGCDPLNLATWFRENCSSSDVSVSNADFRVWFTNAMPERLKHLCRMAILEQLRCRNEYDYVAIRNLPLPRTLIEYLSRKLI